MISKIMSVSNDSVMVCYDLVNDVVCVFTSSCARSPVKTFAGMEMFGERFHELYASFSEAIDVETAINFIKDNKTVI